MRFFLIVILFFSSLSSGLYADEFVQEVARILNLNSSTSSTIQIADNALNQAAPDLITQMHQDFIKDGKNVNRNDVTDLFGLYKTKVIKELRARIIEATAEEYRKHFTLEELKELRTLFETPVFQHYTSKQPELLPILQQRGAELGQEIGAKVLDELIAADPRFR
jgi:hypothetical protein